MKFPQIGQIGESYHSDGKGYFTEQTGMIVEKEINSNQSVLYGLIFVDGKMTWTGTQFIENARWPE